MDFLPTSYASRFDLSDPMNFFRVCARLAGGRPAISILGRRPRLAQRRLYKSRHNKTPSQFGPCRPIHGGRGLRARQYEKLCRQLRNSPICCCVPRRKPRGPPTYKVRHCRERRREPENEPARTLALIGASAGGAAMYRAMTSLGFPAEMPYRGPIRLEGDPRALRFSFWAA